MLSLLRPITVFALLSLACAGCYGPQSVATKPTPPAPPPRPVQPPQVNEEIGAAEAAAVDPPSNPGDAAEISTDDAPLETPAIEAAPVRADAALILYEDSFADVAGSIRRKVDGKQQPAEGPATSRTVYTFQAPPEDGVLTMRVFEDHQTPGSDGEPGVLALAWDEIPKKLPWSGFVYLGGASAEKRMTLPKLQAARTPADLSSLRLRFRYRGVNANSELPVQLQLDCRLEPVLADSFARRIDFGVLVATDEWQSFDLSLADGKNLEPFLKTLAADNPPSFKIVWGQAIPIANYHAGDTLLIDDISVVSVVQP